MLYSFVSQGAGTRHDAYFAWQVNVTWHDADLAFAWRDNAWAVRADQGNTQFVALNFSVQHVQGRNAFGDANDQLDAAERCFKDGILAERSRYVDNAGGCASGSYGFFHGVENRQVQVSGAAFARSNATNHLGAVFDGLLGVEAALRTGDALADNFGVFIDQDAHYLPSAALTTC